MATAATARQPPSGDDAGKPTTPSHQQEVLLESSYEEISYYTASHTTDEDDLLGSSIESLEANPDDFLGQQQQSSSTNNNYNSNSIPPPPPPSRIKSLSPRSKRQKQLEMDELVSDEEDSSRRHDDGNDEEHDDIMMIDSDAEGEEGEDDDEEDNYYDDITDESGADDEDSMGDFFYEEYVLPDVITPIRKNWKHSWFASTHRRRMEEISEHEDEDESSNHSEGSMSLGGGGKDKGSKSLAELNKSWSSLDNHKRSWHSQRSLAKKIRMDVDNSDQNNSEEEKSKSSLCLEDFAMEGVAQDLSPLSAKERSQKKTSVPAGLFTSPTKLKAEHGTPVVKQKEKQVQNKEAEEEHELNDSFRMMRRTALIKAKEKVAAKKAAKKKLKDKEGSESKSKGKTKTNKSKKVDGKASSDKKTKKKTKIKSIATRDLSPTDETATPLVADTTQASVKVEDVTNMSPTKGKRSSKNKTKSPKTTTSEKDDDASTRSKSKSRRKAKSASSNEDGADNSTRSASKSRRKLKVDTTTPSDDAATDDKSKSRRKLKSVAEEDGLPLNTPSRSKRKVRSKKISTASDTDTSDGALSPLSSPTASKTPKSKSSKKSEAEDPPDDSSAPSNKKHTSKSPVSLETTNSEILSKSSHRMGRVLEDIPEKSPSSPSKSKRSKSRSKSPKAGEPQSIRDIGAPLLSDDEDYSSSGRKRGGRRPKTPRSIQDFMSATSESNGVDVLPNDETSVKSSKSSKSASSSRRKPKSMNDLGASSDHASSPKRKKKALLSLDSVPEQGSKGNKRPDRAADFQDNGPTSHEDESLSRADTANPSPSKESSSSFKPKSLFSRKSKKPTEDDDETASTNSQDTSGTSSHRKSGLLRSMLAPIGISRKKTNKKTKSKSPDKEMALKEYAKSLEDSTENLEVEESAPMATADTRQSPKIARKSKRLLVDDSTEGVTDTATKPPGGRTNRGSVARSQSFTARNEKATTERVRPKMQKASSFAVRKSSKIKK